MLQLDDEVRVWRGRLEDSGRFSPSELDELEDHLRSHATEELELSPQSASVGAFRTATREELGEPTALYREFAKSEMPAWRPLLLAGWGLYVLSLLLPGFGTLAFGSARPDLELAASGYEFLRLALANGWILALLPSLPLLMTVPSLTRARRSIEGRLGLVLAGVAASALGLGAFNFLRPLTITVESDLVAHGHLGAGYWTWSASFALVAAALWLRDREWVARPGRSVA